MSRSEAGSSRRHQYVSRACNSCRRRRCRCDGSHPVCMACLSYGYECTWGAEQASDRPATRQFVESLRVKLRLLESEIALIKRDQRSESLSILNHSSDASAHSSPGDFESFISFSNTPPTIGFEKVLSDTRTQTRPLSPKFPQLVYPAHPPPEEIPIVNLPSAIPTPRYQYVFTIDTSLSLDEQYPLQRASLLCQWDRYFPDLSPVKFSRLEHDTILARCFTHGASFSFGLLPDLFLAELLECLSPGGSSSNTYYRYYTPILHCSLMAFGAGLSDNPEIRARATRAKFATYAKGWLDDEFNRPSLSLTLSLALLSEYHSGIGEQSTGHMYMGMAVRAVQSRKPILIGQELGPIAASYPRDLVHTKLTLESLTALEKDRPSELSPPQSSISCPVAIEPDSRPPLTTSFTDLLTHGDYFKHSARCFIQMCRLMAIATQMIDQPVNDKQAVLDIHLQLETWFNALPEAVLIRQRAVLTLPPVLALHITYWWLILHLHYLLAKRFPAEELKDLSTKMRVRAIDKLIHLFNTFDKQFGWGYFPRNLIKAIHTCGSALITERDSVPSASKKKRATATEGIETCLSALEVTGGFWPGVVWMSKDLRTLVDSVG